ncbi:MAG: hypothetical protein AB1443_05065 [Pseudomonadota bacterium]
MAVVENISSTEQSRIEGAKACMEALRQSVESHATSSSASETVSDSFRRMDATAARIMALAGPISPRAAGVLGLLVELAIDSIEHGYSVTGQLEHAQSGAHQFESTMTVQQIEASRARYASDAAEMMEAA